ncbi:arabinogalactan protein 13-like [Papaver somniferum]|uniref:arabinogalactan protein 13-like n=1 Tax=Papaver somniferum TaxID=3469 RepID=UPI000E6F54C0|nr:arabinogalactan protein 13-like [Papaver somniferum]
MAAMKMRVLVAVTALVMAASTVQNVAAAHAPAPSPTSDAFMFVPAVFASLTAVAFGILF